MTNTNEKAELFAQLRRELEGRGFHILNEDQSRPWGGFFVLDEAQAQDFANAYFDGMDVNHLRISGKLSPKVLVVAPHARLSWQYHHRRAEIWQFIRGTAAVVTSDTDEEGQSKSYHPGERIVLRKGERHRLVGLDDWAVVAEIWQHTDPENPSDESDIVRVQDDFGR